ncbi:hypothetical protein [Pseudophaeobacter leonis]|uniref:hypothetical protein n=1 Tax=Pseudophaeobacter leonis TaxID=1144477 RepID=UPI0009F338CC|nr:hypothetical protein [Pseudophaeobacter leonis]
MKTEHLPLAQNFTSRNRLAKWHAPRERFAAYELTNNNANISRMKKRIEQFEAASAAETKRQVFKGVCELLENVEENRLQFLFERKPPAAIRTALKVAGFRWAPSQGAWQRQLNNAARYSPQQVLIALDVAI